MDDKFNSHIYWITKQKVRLTRGRDYAFTIQSLLTLNTFLKVFGLDNPNLYILFNILALVGLWSIGYADEKYLKIWQAENKYLAEDLNPSWRDMHDKIMEDREN